MYYHISIQARLAWEALLFIQIRLGGGGSASAQLDRLLCARLMLELFGSCEAGAEAKQVQDRGEPGGRSFVMMRVSAQHKGKRQTDKNLREP